MLLSYSNSRLVGNSSSSSSSSSFRHNSAPQQQRQCRCWAKRGRPPKNTTTEDIVMDNIEAVEAAPAKRKGRKKKSEVSPAPTAGQAPLTAEMPPPIVKPIEYPHERVVSIEDMTSSVELDYTDNPTLLVPSYTHQAQGHESATQPPLDNYVPFDARPGFVGSEEPPQQQRAMSVDQLPPRAAQQQQQQQQQQGLSGELVAQQQMVGPEVGTAPGEDADEDDELLGYDEPPGLFDYEAGLAYAVTQPPPEQPLEYLPQRLRARSGREALHHLQHISYLGDEVRQEREDDYKERALYYHLQQVRESHNVYLTGKALSVVMAEIELEDTQTGNRTDSFYPIWARAEHRWYPSGRFAAYNEYVKENLPEMTIKYAPGADQEEDFDIMDDVLLMTDDPTMPGAGGGDEAEAEGNPAAGLSIDSFMAPGMLPGAGSSELGAAYLEDVLSPAGDEELEEMLEE